MDPGELATVQASAWTKGLILSEKSLTQSCDPWLLSCRWQASICQDKSMGLPMRHSVDKTQNRLTVPHYTRDTHHR